MSPEVLLCNKYSTKGDVWTFGIVLVEILTYGKEPYEGEKLQLFCSGTGKLLGITIGLRCFIPVSFSVQKKLLLTRIRLCY